MIRVAILPSDAGGCGYYRLFSPLLELQRRGDIRLLCNVAVQDNQAGGLVMEPIGHLPFTELWRQSVRGHFSLPEMIAHQADVIIVQKSGGKHSGHPQEMNLLETVKKHARKVVYEVDDLLEHITKDNPCYIEEVQNNPGYTARMREVMRACRLVTTTTEHLAMELRRITPEVRVVPNGVDIELWRPSLVNASEPDCKPQTETFETPGDSSGAGAVSAGEISPTANVADGRPEAAASSVVTGAPKRVRIGYLASRNHVADSDLLLKPLKYITAHHPEVTFVLVSGFYAKLKEALGDRMEYYNGTPMPFYPEFARRLRLDIAVAPLVGTRFDCSKSPLKMFEAAALGVPCIASYVGPYKDVEALGGWRGVLKQHQWIEALRFLITKPEMRQGMADLQLSAVRDRFTMQHSADAWLDVLREVCAP